MSHRTDPSHPEHTTPRPHEGDNWRQRVNNLHERLGIPPHKTSVSASPQTTQDDRINRLKEQTVQRSLNQLKYEATSITKITLKTRERFAPKTTLFGELKLITPANFSFLTQEEAQTKEKQEIKALLENTAATEKFIACINDIANRGTDLVTALTPLGDVSPLADHEAVLNRAVTIFKAAETYYNSQNDTEKATRYHDYAKGIKDHKHQISNFCEHVQKVQARLSQTASIPAR